jgi:hypothetical protein
MIHHYPSMSSAPSAGPLRQGFGGPPELRAKAGAFGRGADPLVRRSLSRSAFSTDYKYAYIGYTCERLRRVFDFEHLAMAFTSNPFHKTIQQAMCLT